MQQNAVVAQRTASIVQICVQQGFLVPRVPLEEEIVVYNSFHWPKHGNGVSHCRLHTVTQNLRERKKPLKKFNCLFVYRFT